MAEVRSLAATVVVPVVPQGAAAAELRVRPAHVRPPADKLFRGLARGSGFAVLALMTMVGLFLALRAQSALSADGFKFVTTQAWEPESHNFGIAGILTGSVLIALTAIFFALPLALGTALFISEYAPPRLKKGLIAAIDLMAAVPSVVFGLWGFFFFEHSSVGTTRWMSDYLGWIPLLHLRVDTGSDAGNPLASKSYYTGSTFIAGVVVALMVTPIACSVMREAFSQAPLGEREGAYALGATRWGMVRNVVLPFGRGGIIGGTMLGLGRALGETIAVYMVISLTFRVQGHILGKGASSVSAVIAQRYGASSTFAISALMAAGLALFLMTLAVNFGASMIVARSRSGAESEA
ncbi:MAG: phosphate ABC transporter permease subunit PstC [Catenulispora sp.]|nr:phosphate ABC transporter permease subunit PstC [Catenulispora sp.]